jgi:hypothetical protein
LISKRRTGSTSTRWPKSSRDWGRLRSRSWTWGSRTRPAEGKFVDWALTARPCAGSCKIAIVWNRSKRSSFRPKWPGCSNCTRRVRWRGINCCFWERRRAVGRRRGWRKARGEALRIGIRWNLFNALKSHSRKELRNTCRKSPSTTKL